LWSGSDENLKKDIMQLEPVMSKLSKINPIRYKFDTAKLNGLSEEARIGFSAQNLEKVFPECVKDVAMPIVDKEGVPVKDASGAPVTQTYKAVCYSDMIPVLLSAIKEQQLEIDSLRQKINK
jgi:hypothetical protein